jgi:hypothetical protein
MGPAAGCSFYVLVDGAAVVTLDGQEVATYGPGDFSGRWPFNDSKTQ